MSDTREIKRPAVLLHGLDDIAASRAVAAGFLSAGFQVIAACPAGDAAGDAAREPGFAHVEAEKGGALRAGLQYFHDNMSSLPGVVTVDGNGGYTLEDILKTEEAMAANPGKLLVAARRDDPAAGVFARLERLLAWLAFACVHGRSVKDPWAGLRGIPSAAVPALLDLKGEGDRYAFNIVLNLQHKGIKAANVPVSARYGLGQGPGFRGRAGDILRILILPFKFISASLTATLCDYAMYIAFSRLIFPGHAFVSLTVGRGSGAVAGYLLNRSIVFKQRNNTWQKELLAALQFALLALCNYGASWLLLYLLHNLLLINDIVSRLMSDALLFITSYTIQREIIFRKKGPAVK